MSRLRLISTTILILGIFAWEGLRAVLKGGEQFADGIDDDNFLPAGFAPPSTAGASGGSQASGSKFIDGPARHWRAEDFDMPIHGAAAINSAAEKGSPWFADVPERDRVGRKSYPGLA